MKKLSIGLFLIATISFFDSFRAIAQNYFQKNYSGNNQDYVGKAIEKSSDGGYAVAGEITDAFSQLSLAYLLKINSAGDTLWTRELNGIGNYYGHAVRQASDGGIILAGTQFGGDEDVYLLKTDISGNTLWSKTFGSNVNEEGYSVYQTSDGGFVVAGWTNSFGAGNYDAYLVKTDSNGNLLWTKTYGGTNNEVAFAVQQTSDGGLILSGYTTSFSNPYQQAYLIKTDATGNLLWSKTYGTSTINYIGKGVQQTNDGGFVISGSIEDANVKKKGIFLIKTNSTGDTLWTKKYAGDWAKYNLCVGAMPTEGYSVEQTNDGGFIIGGNAVDSCNGAESLLIKTNSSGNLQWTGAYATNLGASGYCARQTNDGGFVITGSSGDNNPTGGINAYLIKTNSAGQSGCNEQNTQTKVSSPQLTVKNPSTQVSSGGISGNAVTQATSGGFVGTLCSAVTNVNELPEEDLVTIYPNPSSGIFTIKNLNSEINACEIINILGENILKYAVQNHETVIDISFVPKGIYFVNFISERTILSQKIIVE